MRHWYVTTESGNNIKGPNNETDQLYTEGDAIWTRRIAVARPRIHYDVWEQMVET
jgi:hypothetical protein